MTGAPRMISLAHTREPYGRCRENCIFAVMYIVNARSGSSSASKAAAASIQSSQDALEDLPIEICLGLEVVVNVGLRQPRFAGDAFRGRASESVQGERLLSGTQDASLVGLADVELSRWR